MISSPNLGSVNRLNCRLERDTIVCMHGSLSLDHQPPGQIDDGVLGCDDLFRMFGAATIFRHLGEGLLFS